MPIGDAAKPIFLGSLIWNLFILMLSSAKLFGCFSLGGWGLFFYNDNGLLNEQCLQLGVVGAKGNYLNNWGM